MGNIRQQEYTLCCYGAEPNGLFMVNIMEL